MLRKDLYVIFTRPVAPKEKIMELLPKHLERQVELEAEVFYSLPARWSPKKEGKPRTGMIIVRAASFEEAHEIAMGDLSHAEGLREFKRLELVDEQGSFTADHQLYSDQSAAVV